MDEEATWLRSASAKSEMIITPVIAAARMKRRFVMVIIEMSLSLPMLYLVPEVLWYQNDERRNEIDTRRRYVTVLAVAAFELGR
mmetsp:Transcript_21224/g.46266  ORF Transcript_21224/g.46266 Transcript_21224/m.46266 type:complete len:84 (-) Transcript_21224:156-407(-)